MKPKQVLEGVKVADFSWVIVGPATARELAEHGATVIHVESHKRLDTLRTLPPFKGGIATPNRSAFAAAYNTGKYGISLDLSRPKGQQIARKLVNWADIVLESMVPGTMARWGLDYEGCIKIKPDIIYCSTCQQGQYGPYSKLPGYGAFSAFLGSFSEVTGWPDREASLLYNNYTDFISPWYLVTALVAALLRRRRTGLGMYLEQSQTEAGITFLGPALLDYSVNQRIATRMGNRDPNMAPHGAYPCRGNDRWLALVVSREEEWTALCKAMGSPQWAVDARFSSFLDRKQNEDELDQLISEWTIDYTAEQLMPMLQEKGVSAGVVQFAADLFSDPQLKRRDHFQYLEHQEIGRMAVHAPAYRLSRTPYRIEKPGPCIGEDNLTIYRDVLGLTEDDISDLIAEGVITTEADLPEFLPGR